MPTLDDPRDGGINEMSLVMAEASYKVEEKKE
jgi:hypothetical protein